MDKTQKQNAQHKKKAHKHNAQHKNKTNNANKSTTQKQISQHEGVPTSVGLCSIYQVTMRPELCQKECNNALSL